MASSCFLFLPLVFWFLFICLPPTSCLEPPTSVLLPVTKLHSTLHYLTTLSYGTPPLPTNVLLHLEAPSLCLDSSSSSSSSSSLFHCLSHSPSTLQFHSHTPPSHSPPQACGTRGRTGELVQHLLALPSFHHQIFHQHFFFTCSPSLFFPRLPTAAKGVVGLAPSHTSLSSHIFTTYNTTHRKFTLCLSSSTGFVLFGQTPTLSPPTPQIFKSLTFTPLSHQFSINVNSIKINGKRLTLNNAGGAQTQLSSIVPYTTMQTSIYATFKQAFLEAAVSMNMTRVAPVEPFGLCFSSRGIQVSRVGPNVPVIELVLQSEMVKWRIHGRNSMVEVMNGKVTCLGFVDGGLNPRHRIVIGGYQLEDVVVQFDLDTSMLGFSPSLLIRNTTCSHFMSPCMPSHSELSV